MFPVERDPHAVGDVAALLDLEEEDPVPAGVDRPRRDVEAIARLGRESLRSMSGSTEPKTPASVTATRFSGSTTSAASVTVALPVVAPYATLDNAARATATTRIPPT